jgi:hypothetical protein
MADGHCMNMAIYGSGYSRFPAQGVLFTPNRQLPSLLNCPTHIPTDSGPTMARLDDSPAFGHLSS